MKNERYEYITYRIGVIRDLITKLRNDLDMTSIIEYNVGEDLWCVNHKLGDSIKYMNSKTDRE